MKKLLLIALLTAYSSTALAYMQSSDYGSYGSYGSYGGMDGYDYKMDGYSYNMDGCKYECSSPDDKYNVPEPGMLGLLAIGLLGMVVARRKK